MEVEKEQEEYKIGGQRSTLAERPLAVIMIIDFGGSGGGGVARVYDATHTGLANFSFFPAAGR